MTAQAPPPLTGSGRASGGRKIGAEYKALVTNVVNLANRMGDTASAGQLTARASTADTVATIVVAGEAKQGKSSLINSLINVEGLCPVHDDIATAAPLRIGYGPKLTATVNLTNGNRLAVDPSELPGWVSMVDAELSQLRQVTSVDVTVPSPILERGVVLVDTPGVGGLVAGHARMTLRSLESATALLFVTDADVKLTDYELQFLANAGERIAAVVFVVTKKDRHPGWREVIAEDREVLARYAPRYADAPMVAVSARLAARARAVAQTDRPLSADLFAESGIGQLQGWISRIRPVATTLSLANTVALSSTTLEGLRATAERSLAADTADPAVTAAFEEEKSRVAALRNDQMTWGTTLERRLFESRDALRDQVKVSSEAMRAAGAGLVKSSNSRGTNLVVAQIDADIDAQAQDLSAALNETVASVCARMLAGLNIASPLELSVAGSGVVTMRQFEPAATGPMSLLTGGMAAATGWGVLARVAGQSTVSTALMGALGVSSAAIGIGIPLLGAVGVGYAIHHIRSGATRRTELGAWARTEIDRATNDRYADVERVLTSARLDITEVVRAALFERDREVSASLDQARTARDLSLKEREARARTDHNVVAEATKLISTADELLGALLTAASMTAPNAPNRPRSGLV